MGALSLRPLPAHDIAAAANSGVALRAVSRVGDAPMSPNEQTPSGGAFAEGGAMVDVTKADRGLVERPMLAPHLEFRIVGEASALLVSEGFSSLLRGRRYADILPLLDGSRTRREVAAALADKYSRVEVQTALVALASKGRVVSAEFSIGRPMAAFWCAHGVSPRRAEERLAAAPVAVSGDEGGLLSAALDETGVVAAEKGAEPALAVFVTDDYLAESHAATNRRHIESGVPWTLVRPTGLRTLMGPVFRPRDADAPCWKCLEHRMRGNGETDNYLRNAFGETARIPASPVPPPFGRAVLGLAAVEIARWIVLGDPAPLRDHVHSLDSLGPQAARHKTMRRPQCPACGQEDLHRPDRAPAPLRLRSNPKPIRNSGGLRSARPVETVRKYRHLISPVSGVVTELARVGDETDPWLHVYWAGSNLALRNESVHTLRSSLRSKSSGKGASPEQAEASALCEAVERYSGVFHGDEIRRRARFSDFSDGDAIHPNAVQNFSDRQYEHADEINARRMRFNYVPQRFDADAEMDWSPAWSLTAGRHRWLPTSMLYFSAPLKGKPVYCPPDSNGCAAGNTLEEAILQGFFELVERDAFACWWYNRVALPEVDLESFDDPYLSGARGYYRAHNRELWVLDATNDLGVPAFVAVSRRTDKEAQDIIYAGGAHSDPYVATMRALCELNQHLSAVRDAGADGSGYLVDDPEANAWWRDAKIGDHPWLAPAPDASCRGMADYPAPQVDDLRDEVERCRAIVESRGMEFLALDQTRPDIGMPVARTIVPGMRHFWARFAPGRLYDVPVELGWRDAPLAEEDLNPVRVFI